MRIAFCIFNYFPYGGLQRDFFRILKASIKRGHRIDVYTQQWQGEFPDGINVFIIPVTGLTNHARAHNFIRKTSRKLLQDQHDCVVGFNKMPGLDWCFVGDVCLKNKIKGQFWRYLLPRYRHYLTQEKAVFGKASKTKMMLLTPKQREDYERVYPDFASRIFLLPPGIAKNQLSDKEMVRIRNEIRSSAELSVSPNQMAWLFVAMDFYNKGLDRVIQALAALSRTLSVVLWVIGSDKQKQQYTRLAQRYQVLENIRFLGAKKNVFDYMLAADVLVHPARVEAAGMVLLEALTAGLPIVATANCGYAFHVEQARAGMVLNEPFSQENFNQALFTMMTQNTLRLECCDQARQYANAEDFYSLTDRAVKLIERK